MLCGIAVFTKAYVFTPVRAISSSLGRASWPALRPDRALLTCQLRSLTSGPHKRCRRQPRQPSSRPSMTA